MWCGAALRGAGWGTVWWCNVHGYYCVYVVAFIQQVPRSTVLMLSICRDEDQIEYFRTRGSTATVHRADLSAGGGLCR
jgi:hypothetical protein